MLDYIVDSLKLKHFESKLKNVSDTNEVEEDRTTGVGHSASAERDLNRNIPVYICSYDYMRNADKHPKVPFRASMVHSLIYSYGLLKKLKLSYPAEANENDLRLHHTQEYISLLKLPENENNINEYEEYGLGYDCPVLESTFDFVKLMCGATLTAAQCLIEESSSIAINWGGGWHHAKRDQASGFCYANDIVLGILKLREKFDKVLYVDLDLHHGDGVEEAFVYTAKVMTVSFHMYEPGFFPGSGSVHDVGFGRGKYHTVNVPLKQGIRNEKYIQAFLRVMNKVYSKFKPDVIVCQCGADCISGDPMSGFNLSPEALGECVQLLLSWQIPILFLGGGGYNLPNTARCWTYLTSIIVGESLDSNIPDDDNYFMSYKPGFELEVSPGNCPDTNNDEYLEGIIKIICENLDNII